eukprot:g6414.t1
MDAGMMQTEVERGSSPTRSAQEVLRRMSLNSPPSRADNPRQIKRAKLLAGEAGATSSRPFTVPQAAQTPAPATVRKLVPPASRAAALEGPSPMPSWGVNLRDASAGDTLEADDHDPSSFYPSFQLDCLRQPYGGPSSPTSGGAAGGGGRSGGSPGASSTSTTMDDDDDDHRDEDDRRSFNHHASLRAMESDGDDDAHAPSPCPARLRMDDGDGGSRRRGVGGGGAGGFAAALEEARGDGGGGGTAGIPETPLRRPGSGARSRALERAGGAGRGDGSCSPVGGYAGLHSSAAQGSPVKKRGVGRLRLSEEGRREAAAGLDSSPLRSNHNPFSPDGEGRGRGGAGGGGGGQGDAMSMPAPAPRSRLSSGRAGSGGASQGSPMDTGDVVGGVDFDSLAEGMGGDRKDEGSFLRRVRSRVDGCLYAVKCSRRRFKGESDRQKMLMEVYALAAVCDSAQETLNIVRYHQAWIEDERLYIQTELCETSLEKQLESGHRLEIDGVYAFLRQTLLGLEILHQHKLVHLDIKPGNIFVKNGQYKLGDFGLVTPVHVRSDTDVVEGDSRYMSKELLNDDHSNLTKCDVFSLGITLYEIISGRPLPPNGEEWHRLRSGKAGMPMGLPAELSKALHEMMHPDPSRRPSAAELLRYPCLQSEMERQLNDQRSKLNKERTRNSGLIEEVSALIQRQSHRSGRLSRTVTWDNSYFAANGGKGDAVPSDHPPTKPLGGTPDRLASRGSVDGSNGTSAVGQGHFIPSHPKASAKTSGFFGGDESGPARFGSSVPGASMTGGSARSGPGARADMGGAAGGRFGQGMLGLSSVEEKEEEEAAVSPMNGGWSMEGTAGGAEGSRPVSFERLRQAES